MAELTITTYLTLDGVIQAPGGPTEDPSGGFPYGGWLAPYFDAEAWAFLNESISKAGAFLLGRRTYDIFSAYWPAITDPEYPVAGKLNSLPKFVASRTQTEFSWSGTSPIRDVVKEVPSLKQRFSGEIQIFGSAGLAQTLIKNDLIDEYRLLTFPVILGTGKRFFSAGTGPAALTLARSGATGSGVVISVYRRGGALQTGTV